jgi:hypothetical protein
MKTIKEFCDKHDACRDGRAWALAHCKDMTEVWQTAKPEWLVWIATREGVLTDVELRRFAVWSARQVQHLMNDERSVNALDVAERYANGAATDEELAAAHAAAADATSDARAAARAAADDAADAARAAAACAAARATAYATARAAAVCAADAARTAYAAAYAAADAAQAQWLRENTNPNFA